MSNMLVLDGNLGDLNWFDAFLDGSGSELFTSTSRVKMKVAPVSCVEMKSSYPPNP